MLSKIFYIVGGMKQEHVILRQQSREQKKMNGMKQEHVIPRQQRTKDIKDMILDKHDVVRNIL